MKKWNVDIKRTTHDRSVVVAETEEKALLKAQTDIYQLRVGASISAVATERKVVEGQDDVRPRDDEHQVWGLSSGIA